MRVLATGGAGFVGSHVVERLVSGGNEVLVVDDLSTGKRTNVPDGAEFLEVDIGDALMQDAAVDFRPDAILHCAAQASVPVSTEDPALDARTNILGGINVCQAAIKSGCGQFVYVNTGGALYGNPEYLPCNEDHPIRPISGYGLSKWTLELYLRLLLPTSTALKVMRLANVYGPRQDPNGEAGVVAIFGQRMLRGEQVIIDGDGEQTRDFVYVGDVAEANELAMTASGPLTVNIGTGVPTSVNSLFGLMASGTEYEKTPKRGPERAGDVKHIYLDASEAKGRLGWTPKTDLLEGLRMTLSWMGSHDVQ